MSKVLTFSYTNEPGNNNRDAVRFELGDTIESKALLDDNEIDYALTKESDNILRAASRCAESIAARFAREAQTRTGTVTKQNEDLYAHYKDLALRLRQRAVTSSGFVVPSIFTSQKSDNEQDTSLVQPSFRRGIHNNIGSVRDEKTSLT